MEVAEIIPENWAPFRQFQTGPLAHPCVKAGTCWKMAPRNYSFILKICKIVQFSIKALLGRMLDTRTFSGTKSAKVMHSNPWLVTLTGGF